MAANSIRLACAGALAVALLGAEDGRVQRPVLGYFVDQQGELRLVEGIAAAARMARMDGAPSGLASAAAVPQRSFALGVRATDGAVVLIRVAGGSPEATILDGLPANPAGMAVSPGGTSAAILYSDSAIIVSGLPDSPTVSAPIAAAAKVLTVSDDGVAMLARSEEGVFLLSTAADARLIAPAPQLTDAAFLPGGHDAIFTESASNRLGIIRDVTGAAELSWLDLSDDGSWTPRAVTVSNDAKRAVVAGDGHAVVVDLSAGTRTSAACSCGAARFERWNGTDVFRIGGNEKDGLLLFSASGEPQVLSVPPVIEGGDQ